MSVRSAALRCSARPTSSALAGLRAKGGPLLIACLSVALLGFATTILAADPQPVARWPAERRAGPFHFHADFPLEPDAKLLDSLAHLQSDVESLLKIRTGREPIHLLLFRERSVYNAYVQIYFPKVPKRPALFIKAARGPGMVFAVRKNANFAIDLRHEATHALLHSALPVVPLWLDEGLAEYFEEPRATRQFHHPSLLQVRWGVRLGMSKSIEKLEAVQSLRQMQGVEYRYSWAWAHFLLQGPPEVRRELIAYLHDLEAERIPGILSKRLRLRLPDLNRRFARHFQNWRGK